jgi:hypothetical protein
MHERPSRFLPFCLARATRAMFSKPLAYPSSLDRASRGCAAAARLSFVEELWSPILVPHV